MTCRVLLKKSGSRTPRIELEEIGPSLDLTLRRVKLASDDLYKRSLKQPKTVKVTSLHCVCRNLLIQHYVLTMSKYSFVNGMYLILFTHKQMELLYFIMIIQCSLLIGFDNNVTELNRGNKYHTSPHLKPSELLYSWYEKIQGWIYMSNVNKQMNKSYKLGLFLCFDPSYIIREVI